jgi:hypothetical protein
MKINFINILGQRLQKIILHRSGGPAVLHQVRPEWVEGGAVPRPPPRGVPAASATPPPTPSGPTRQPREERTLLEVGVKAKEYYREKDSPLPLHIYKITTFKIERLFFK